MKGVLPHQEILSLVPSVIVGGDVGCVRTASYDMRLGEDYYLHDDTCSDGKQIRQRGTGVVSIPPNGVLLCTMHESLKLPKDMVGHLSLKVALLMKGIMMASQSQIDAGYEGKIFAMLYNLSHRDVCLRDGEPVLRLELVRLEQETTKPYDNTNSKTATLSRHIDAPLIGSLVGIRKEASSAVDKVEQAKDRISHTQLWGSLAITVALGIIGLFAQAHFASESDVESLKARAVELETKWKVLEKSTPPEPRLVALEAENKALRARLQELENVVSARAPRRSAATK
jgi:deoxycytidine triphosphate deaminase